MWEQIPGVLSLHEQGDVTDSEASATVLGYCAFALREHPDAWPTVAGVLALVPPRLLRLVGSFIEAKRHPEGGWLWPPVGGIGRAGPTRFGQAGPREAAVYEALAV
jgi:hypothetical protein